MENFEMDDIFSSSSTDINIALKEIDRNIDTIDWNMLSRHMDLHPEIIRKYSDKLNWELISIYHDLGREFCAMFNKNLDHNIIEFRKQLRKLSINTIKEFVEILSNDF